MDKKREEIMARARQKRNKRRAAAMPAADQIDIVGQVKEVAIIATETVGELVTTAVKTVKQAVTAKPS